MRSVITIILMISGLSLIGCSQSPSNPPLKAEPVSTITPFWHDANVYFMLLDRFKNGNPENDTALGRDKPSAYLRGIHGGDLQGVIDKLDEGYFNALGIDAIWFTPIIEQIHGQDHSSGATYAYHGYWPKDWTTVDPVFGSEEKLAELVTKARAQGIKVLLDVIINHTGPVTDQDPMWPNAWVRRTPVCTWDSFAANVTCGLNDNLPDIKTESDSDTPLPEFLLEKWQREGRLQQETQELDAFFARTGLPRAPKNYIVKWLTDWVKEYGIDGFRVDTAKHVEPEIWAVLEQEANYSLQLWRDKHPQKVTHNMPFFMMGEVMHFGVDGHRDTPAGTRLYDFGDKQVDFFDYGFDSLINMGFAAHAHQDYDTLFSQYSEALNEGPLKGVGILNYIVSHDDPEPYDPDRQSPFETANKLVLSPGAVQIYYGDEVSRPMDKKDTTDAKLRLSYDWDTLSNPDTQKILAHWQKLLQFRKHHQALGSGVHKKLDSSPYVFSRVLSNSEKVVVALDYPSSQKVIDVSSLWTDGTVLMDHYSGTSAQVIDGKISIRSGDSVVLLSDRILKR